MVSFTKCLTGLVDRSRFLVFLVFCNVCIGFVRISFVGVCLTTIIIVVIAGTVRHNLGWVFFSFELTALVSIVTWFLQCCQVGWGFSGFCCLACCVRVFICSSSWASKPFNSKSPSRCDTISSYVPFSKCAWLIDFFMWGGILAYMNCSMIAWAATPIASFASFRSLSRKSINFWFAGLKASRWSLCFAVAIDWGFTHFLRNTGKISATFSLIGLVMFLNVCSASPCMREWKDFILSSSVSWLFIFKRFWNRSSMNLNFSDFASRWALLSWGI